MRAYTEDDFTTVDFLKTVVHVCDGCGANFFFRGKFDRKLAQTNHYAGCSTEEIDKETERVNNGYYYVDEEDDIDDGNSPFNDFSDDDIENIYRD